MRLITCTKVAGCSILLMATAFGDIKITTLTTLDGRSAQTNTYIKAGAVRSEMLLPGGNKLITIEQCENDQVIQINEAAKTYFIGSLSGGDLASPSAAQPESGVTLFEEFRDTGEQKELFRRPARHIKGSVTSGSDECLSDLSLSTEGWYVDVPWPACARSTIEQRLQSLVQSCTQNIRYKLSGSARTGYPVLEEYRLKGKFDQREAIHEVRTEVTAIENLPLDPRLFSAPNNYREVNSIAELMGVQSVAKGPEAAAPPSSPVGAGGPQSNAQASGMPKPVTKKAGVLRVCIAKVTSSANETLPTVTLQQELLKNLKSPGLDAFPLNTNPDDHDALESEAQTQECDYFVTSDITSIKGAPISRAGGRTSVQVSVKAYLPGQMRPVLDGANDYSGAPEFVFAELMKIEARSIASEIRKVKR